MHSNYGTDSGQDRIESMSTPADPFAAAYSPIALPLMPMQRGMMYAALEEPSTLGAYVEQVIGILEEDIDFVCFEDAWKIVLHRHDALRTRFEWKDLSDVRQIVESKPEVDIEFEDWWEDVPEDIDAKWTQFLEADRSKGIRLSASFLYRLSMIRVSESEYRLVWTVFHGLVDGRSLSLVVREVFECYDALLRKSPWEPNTTRSFTEYLPDFERAENEKAKRFWSKELAELEQPTEFRFGSESRLHPTKTNYRSVSTVLSEDQVRVLNEFAADTKVTLHTVLQGAWALVLNRHGKSDDVLFGVTKSIRDGLGISQDVAGLFINTLPVRVSFDSKTTVREWLQSLRADWIGMRDFERSSLSEIASWSEFSAETPLLSSYLVYERESFDDAVNAESRGSSKRQFELLERTPAPITIAIYGEGPLDIHIEYSTKFFREEDVDAVLGRFVATLELLAANVNEVVRGLSLITESDEHVLNSLQEGPKIDVLRRPVSNLFEQMVEEQPDAFALEFKNDRITYSELNERANKLAHGLIRMGVQKDMSVALYLPRSVELVVGMMGVLKAGGGYIPIDIEAPATRIDYILQDSAPQIVITLPDLATKMRDFEGTVVELTSTYWNDSKLPSGNPDVDFQASHLAYCIYTSGSTGQPKGVQIEHGSFNSFVCAAQARYGFKPTDRVLQFASPGFDTAVEEIFPTLLSGGTLVLRTDDMVTHASDFFRIVDSMELTILDLPTAFWHLLAQDVTEESIPESVRLVIIGGEAAHKEKLEKWLLVVPDSVQLFNTYGPTETTVVAAYSELTKDSDLTLGVPIGTPLPGVVGYVLGEDGLRVPPGVTGELYLGGLQVARGYLNDEKKTSQNFLSLPQISNERLYKTGDRVRQCANGDLVYLGRFDRQVKVRGFRVELGEIESLLETSPMVKSAAVISSGDERISRLAAYIEPNRNGVSPSVTDIQHWASSVLPHYMRPAWWTLMDSMPLTPSGKIDRRALPDPSQKIELENQTPTQTVTEQKLAAIWAEVLGLQNVGRDTVYLDLGGDSLSAVQITSRARSAFAVEVPMEQFMGEGTVASMAAFIDGAPKQPESWNFIPRADRSKGVPLAFDQQVVWLFERLFAGTQTYHIPVVYRLEGTIDGHLIRKAVNQVIARHEALRTTFAFEDKIPRQYVLPKLKINLPTVAVEAEPGMDKMHAVQRHLATLVSKPFDVHNGPLIRGTLLQLDEKDHFLCMTVHHLVSDGWSVGVLVKEIVEIYCAYQDYRTPRLPELPVQYSDFSVWQREHFEQAGGPTMEYWKNVLELPLPRILWPKDSTPPEEDPRQGALYPIQFSKELTDRIKKLADESGTTPFMQLLSLFKIAIHQYTEVCDVIMGVVLANRNRVEIEPLIGFFISTVVTRAKIKPGMDFNELLDQVRHSLNGAHAHPDMPFEKIREVVSDEVNSTPFLQVLFLMQSMDLPPMNLPGTKATTVNVDMGKSIMDLTLELYETPDGYRGWFEYCNNLFSRGAIARMATLLEALAEAVTAVPDSLLTALPHYDNVEANEIPSPIIWDVPLEPRMLSSQKIDLTGTPTDPESLAIEQKVIEIWERILRKKPLNRTSNFFGHGGDSLLSLIMLEIVDREFGLHIEPVQMYQAPVIAQFAQLVYQKHETKEFKAMHGIHSVGVRPPLFFAGSTNLLPDLAKELPGDQPLYSMNIFGLNVGRGDAFIFEVADVAAEYLSEIRVLQPQGPYYIAGFCQESLVALEMARQLEVAGERVGALILIDFVPTIENPLSWCLRHVRNIKERGIAYIGDKLNRRVSMFVRRLRALKLNKDFQNKSTTEKSNSKVTQQFGLIDHYNEALYEYDVEHFGGSITFIAASEWNFNEPPEWLFGASDDVTLKEVPSCHYDLWEHPNVEYLAAAIHHTLDRAQLSDPDLIPLATDDPEDNPQRKD